MMSAAAQAAAIHQARLRRTSAMPASTGAATMTARAARPNIPMAGSGVEHSKKQPVKPTVAASRAQDMGMASAAQPATASRMPHHTGRLAGAASAGPPAASRLLRERREDDFATGVAFQSGPEGFRGLLQRVGPLDVDGEFAGVGQRGEPLEFAALGPHPYVVAAVRPDGRVDDRGVPAAVAQDGQGI